MIKLCRIRKMILKWWLRMDDTKLAAWLGDLAEERLHNDYPGGLVCKVGVVFMTRGKRLGTTSVNEQGMLPWQYMVRRDFSIYEVVYEAQAYDANGVEQPFVLSFIAWQRGIEFLTQPQMEEAEGSMVRMTKYACQEHLCHHEVIKKDLEVYPDMRGGWQVLQHSIGEPQENWRTVTADQNERENHETKTRQHENSGRKVSRR